MNVALFDPRFRKWLVAAVAALAQVLLLLQYVLSLDLLRGKLLAGVQTAVAVLSAVLVRQATNGPPTPSQEGGADHPGATDPVIA